MGKGDALKSEKISLVLPTKLYKMIEKTELPDCLSIQDKIRRLLVIALVYMEEKEGEKE